MTDQRDDLLRDLLRELDLYRDDFCSTSDAPEPELFRLDADSHALYRAFAALKDAGGVSEAARLAFRALIRASRADPIDEARLGDAIGELWREVASDELRGLDDLGEVCKTGAWIENATGGQLTSEHLRQLVHRSPDTIYVVKQSRANLYRLRDVARERRDVARELVLALQSVTRVTSRDPA